MFSFSFHRLLWKLFKHVKQNYENMKIFFQIVFKIFKLLFSQEHSQPLHSLQPVRVSVYEIKINISCQRRRTKQKILLYQYLCVCISL